MRDVITILVTFVSRSELMRCAMAFNRADVPEDILDITCDQNRSFIAQHIPVRFHWDLLIVEVQELVDIIDFTKDDREVVQ